MVFAVSSMQEDLRANAHDRSSGTGGFALVAESTFPLLDDPFGKLDMPGVSGTAIKVRDGDDASCLNLNRAQTPRILGVTASELTSRGAFSKEVWELLDIELPDGAIPAIVGDSNTAMFNLMKKTGPESGNILLYTDTGGNEVQVKLVGALPMRLSVFQGSILISDEAFTRLYPSEDGHRMFLVDAPEGEAEAVAARLAQAFDRFGLDAVPAVDRLLEYYTVETTYLAMFLVLGGLGLAVGSAGMGVVVLRNLLERRGELAMLSALGFGKKAIYQVLFTEYGVLLAAGLGVGAVAAAVSVLPTLVASDSSVNLGVQVPVALLVLLASASCMTLAILTGFRQDDADALRNE
jgi:ABC-type antimicrobial peptide transport system permease subunit